MSFPRYPEYKDSGVKWLGEVPKHWEVRPIKAMAMLKGGAGFPDAEQGVEKEELYFYKVAALGQADAKGVLQAPPDSVSRDTAKRLGAFVFPAGSLTFAKVGAALLLARIRQLPAPSCLDNNMMGMLVNQVNDTRFVLFAMSLVRFDLIANPGAVPSLNASQIGNFQLALPPLAEQAAIATFLDRETAKIDALVAEQEKLIALLQEKRQAVISHAVTKGLDPNVPMKDSGVEWLGEVPGHWEVGAIKRFVSSLDGRRVPLSAEERSGRQGEFPYYGASGVIDSIDAYIFEEDLVLVSEDGANLLSRVTPIAFVASGKYWVNNHAHILKPIDANVRFWAERIEALELAPVISGAAQPKLTIEALMNLVIAVPPTADERASIAFYIQVESMKLDSLQSEARTAISLLQERRTALISAAVTGQIDVRGLAGGANAPDSIAANA